MLIFLNKSIKSKNKKGKLPDVRERDRERENEHPAKRPERDAV